jgi:hypothetical protein
MEDRVKIRRTETRSKASAAKPRRAPKARPSGKLAAAKAKRRAEFMRNIEESAKDILAYLNGDLSRVRITTVEVKQGPDDHLLRWSRNVRS